MHSVHKQAYQDAEESLVCHKNVTKKTSNFNISNTIYPSTSTQACERLPRPGGY